MDGNYWAVTYLYLGNKFSNKGVTLLGGSAEVGSGGLPPSQFIEVQIGKKFKCPGIPSPNILTIFEGRQPNLVQISQIYLEGSGDTTSAKPHDSVTGM